MLQDKQCISARELKSLMENVLYSICIVHKPWDNKLESGTMSSISGFDATTSRLYVELSSYSYME